MYFARDYRAMARKSLQGHWGVSVVVAFLAMILGGLTSESIVAFNIEEGTRYWSVFGVPVGVGAFQPHGYQGGMGFLTGFLVGASVIAVLYALFVFLIGGAIELGVRNYFLKLNYDMNPSVEDMFRYLRYFGRALGLRIVMGLFIVLWSLLLVIPGIVAAYRYSMATYLMAENPDIGIIEAIDQSKAMMMGRKWSLFCLDLSFIGWHILCGFTFGIGYIFLHPYMESARAHFYLTIKHGMRQ